MEKQFNAEESLSLIQQMITVTKKGTDKTSFYFLLWGYICVLGNLLGYLWIYLEKYNYIGLSWQILGFLGIITTIVYSRIKARKARVRTYIDDCMRFTWYGYLVAISTLMFFLVKGQHFDLIGPSSLLMLSLPTFITGGVLRFKPFIFGAIILWAIGVLTIFLSSPEWENILNALAIVFGYLIPGHLLKASYKDETI